MTDREQDAIGHKTEEEKLNQFVGAAVTLFLAFVLAAVMVVWLMGVLP